LPIYQVVVLAIVQAITEFLPISSTAHLALVPWLLKWHDPGLVFDVALHVGTLVAVLVYFWRLWIRLLLSGLGLKRLLRGGLPAGGRSAAAPAGGNGPVAETVAAAADPAGGDEDADEGRLLWLLALGTVPAAVVGLLFEDAIRTTLRSPLVMAGSLIVVAFVLWWGERLPRHTRGLRSVGLVDVLVVGCAQAVALVPGVSRSGITIIAALARNFRRDTAARFSFLLATPAVAGAAVLEAAKLMKTGIAPDMRLPFIVGTVISAIAGYAVIAFFIRYLQTRTLMIFVYYRLVFGVIILALAIFSSAP